MKAYTREKKRKRKAYHVSYANHLPLKDFRISSSYTLGKDVLKLNGNEAYTGKNVLDEFTQHKLQKLRI